MPSEKFFPTLFQHFATDTARNLAISAGAGKTAVLTRQMTKFLREQKLLIEGLMLVSLPTRRRLPLEMRIKIRL